jgi:DNA-directed RNA polymerase
MSLPGFMWHSQPRMHDPRLSRLEAWDPARPLVVHDNLSVSSPTLRNYNGIGGDPTEMHQNLHACLRVGRMDRAAAILHRLTDMYDPSADEVLDAHNVYLETMLEHALQDPSRKAMVVIEDWVAQELMHKGVEPNGRTLVVLLRAAMNFLEGLDKTDTIRKYLTQAHEAGPAVLKHVNESSEFTDEEWETLIRFQPETYQEPPAVEEVQGMQISTPAGQALAMQHGLIPDPSLTVKPVAQKGMGLTTLKMALGMFEPGEAPVYPTEHAGTQEEKDKTYAFMRQLRLEEDSTKAAVDRWRAEDSKLQDLGIHGVLQTKPVQALMWHWYSALLPRLQDELEAVKRALSAPVPKSVRASSSNNDERLTYGPYLEQCSAQQLAALTVSRIISAAARNQRDDFSTLKLAVLSLDLGKDIENEVNHTAKLRHEAFLRKTRGRTRQGLLAKLSKDKRPAQSVDQPADPGAAAALDVFRRTEFPLHIKARIGALCLENLVQSGMITVVRVDPKTGKQLTSTQPAFQHKVVMNHGKRVGCLLPHDEVMTKLRTEALHSISVVRLPMVVEPKPWVSYEQGGYYTVRQQAIRIKTGDFTQRAYAVSAIENQDMSKVLSGLDVLGKVPWNINQDVFRVMVEAWNKGLPIGGLVTEEVDVERPVEPPSDASFSERFAWGKRMKEYSDYKGGLHSQRCFQNFQLEIARAFMKETIYYPHSVDFRGRAYPIPPVLNHIGADVSRGLLTFANGKELGAVGLQWLKVHMANLYGYDKASLRDREQFASDHLDDIRDSVANPLGGKMWWTKAEDPWQCLACCFELKAAHDMSDPTRYVSKLPVHQDGTCNGLQHYAALGGDRAGATQVNLEPSDRPQDIYTGVAELVNEMVVEDVKKNNAYAKFMDGKVTRKVVKRTVMTNVYGVTFIGAKRQVHDELKAIFPNFQVQDGIPSLSMVANYIAHKIFAALGKIFNGAQEIQYWLGECGDRITTSMSPSQIAKLMDRAEGRDPGYDAKYKAPLKMTPAVKKKLEKDIESFKTSIIWTTPLKMPVVQPYRKESLHIVKTTIQNITLSKQSAKDEIDRRKQLQAFPPNFIHSLDASHMLLSALKCSELGIDFAAVHDSFWTHAADIPNLNVVLRDSFVRMHSEDIMGRLAAEFTARYKGHMYCARINASSAAAAEITVWRRERSKKPKAARFGDASFEELALEAKRQELLKCEDAEARAEGEAMVTPTTIWLKYSDPLSLASQRMTLLGETKHTGGGVAAEIKEKVLGAEAEVMQSAEHAVDEYDAAAEYNLDVEVDADVDAEADAEADTSVGTEAVPAKKKLGRPTKAAADRKGAGSVVKVWLPLTFPPVPKKGDWDVTRLRDSKYFFS